MPTSTAAYREVHGLLGIGADPRSDHNPPHGTRRPTGDTGDPGSPYPADGDTAMSRHNVRTQPVGSTWLGRAHHNIDAVGSQELGTTRTATRLRRDRSRDARSKGVDALPPWFSDVIIHRHECSLRAPIDVRKSLRDGSGVEEDTPFLWPKRQHPRDALCANASPAESGGAGIVEDRCTLGSAGTRSSMTRYGLATSLGMSGLGVTVFPSEPRAKVMVAAPEGQQLGSPGSSQR